MGDDCHRGTRVVTITELVRLPGIPSTSKLEVLQRADRVFAQRAGRYCGSRLTLDEVEQLVTGVEMSPLAREAATR